MSRKRILVVDDEAGFTRMLKLNLEQTGRYEVRSVNVPEEALRIAREFRPDLVLMDMFMPRMNGSDVAAQFRQDSTLQDRPIIFFTAASKTSRDQAHGGRPDHAPVLAKPVSLEEVVAAIEQQLQAAGGGATPAT
jgi:CheY-like chemotaxis protein